MQKDPYRYFRIEAQELVDALGKGFLDLEAGGGAEDVRRILRHAHTFKGAARVVRRTDLADLAHEIEDLVEPHRDAAGTVAKDIIQAGLAKLERMRTLVATLGPEPIAAAATTSEVAPSPPVDTGRAIPIQLRDLDRLMSAASEAHIACSATQRAAGTLARVHDRLIERAAFIDDATILAISDEATRAQRELVERLARLEAEIAEVRASASDLRLVSARLLESDLTHLVRDAARALGKELELRFTGQETEIDAYVLSGLRKALVHVVQNAVAHGIEDRAERMRAEKPPIGRFEVSIERRGHRVVASCHDDGRGIDWAALQAIAERRGLVAPKGSGPIDEDKLSQLLLRGGLSTARTVTGIAGRGVGLDAVRNVVEGLGGELRLTTHAGVGTTLEIAVPVSLASLPALAVKTDDVLTFVPLDAVRKTLRAPRAAIVASPDGERLTVDGRVLPFVSMSRALRPGAARPRAEIQSVIVLEAAGRVGAIGVDQVFGAETIVVRNIPAHAAASEMVSGATFDDEGSPRLVLRPSALIQAASAARSHAEPVAVARRLPLLVIDDSLTTRMLEQSILESVGYEVDLAASAEEGLEKAVLRRYGVFIVDVEMPGMSGFEFIATARAHPELREVPAILVTSRGDPEDKRRGKDLGVRAYIVKGEFDQAALVESIRRLVG